MRTLTGSSIPNIDTSDATNFPKGRFKNDTGLNTDDGTEVSERTLGDLYQFMVEILRIYDITPNENPEKKELSQVANAITGNGLYKESFVVSSGDVALDFAKNIIVDNTSGASHTWSLTQINGGSIGDECTVFLKTTAEAGTQINLHTPNSTYKILWKDLKDSSPSTLYIRPGGAYRFVKIATDTWQLVGGWDILNV